MHRRTFLTTVGVTSIAGCSSSKSNQTETASPNVEFVGADAPESVPLNVPRTFSIRLRNTGSSEETFNSPLGVKQNDGEWEKATDVSLTIPAGETKQWNSARFALECLGKYQFKLHGFDATWSIEAVPKRLDFGNFYAVPTGLYINPLGGSFELEYPTEDNRTVTNQTATSEPTPSPRTPTDGEQWLVMRVDVRNRLEEPQLTPPASKFVLTVDGEPRPLHQDVSDDPYNSHELDGRTVTRSDLVYSVPANTEEKDISLTWSSSLSDGDVKAIWTK